MKEFDFDIMFQLVLDSLPIYVFWKDRNCRYLGCNQAFAEIAGLESPLDLIGKSDYELIWTEQAEHFQKDDKYVMENDKPKLDIIEKQTQPDGLHWVETNKIPIKNSAGEVIGILGSFNDITEKVKLQDERVEREKNSILSTLAGGISHDLNNSLSIISGLVNLCQKDFQDNNKHSRLPEHFSKIKNATKKSSLLTKRFMNFSKDKSEQTKQIINVENFVEDTCSLLMTGFFIPLEYDIQKCLPYIFFDESQLSQVLNNLIINAKQASPKSAPIVVNVTSNLICDDDNLKDGEYIKIKVIDKGRGISENDLQNIFTTYFTTKKTGNGLGLSSCKSILKTNGGSIAVESELNQGTTFTIYIPVTDQKQNHFIFTKELIEGNGLIYLVDDDESLRQTTEQLLQSIGYQVKSFSSGEEMIENLKNNHSCDLIITDYYLLDDHFNGDDICKEVKKLNNKLPVILLSGFFKNTENINKYDFILRKPLDLPRLSQLLDRLIQK